LPAQRGTHATPLFGKSSSTRFDAFSAALRRCTERRRAPLPDGRYRIDYPARAPFVPAHAKPLRVNGQSNPDGTSPNMISMLTVRAGLSRQESDNIFGSTAVNFFGRKQFH